MCQNFPIFDPWIKLIPKNDEIFYWNEFVDVSENFSIILRSKKKIT